MTSRVRSLIAALAVVVLALVAGTGAASAQSSEQLEIKGVDANAFPLVRAVVAGPALDGELDDAFVVREGETELTADVVRLRTENLNLVVAIDVSGSMDGEPLARGKEAVSELLANLPPDVPVSVVSFGSSSVQTHPFSTDRASIQASVDALVAGGGTALFDGIDRSLSLLEAQGGTGALVVLADGADSDSATPVAELTDRLANAGVVSEFVALQSPDYDGGQVQSLAQAANGSVTAVAAAGDLASAFGDIASGLSGTYEVRWQSVSEGTTGEISIALASDPGSAITATFQHPEVAQFVPQIATDTRTVGGAGPFQGAWIPLFAALAVSAGALLLISLLRGAEGATERREERREQKQRNKEERHRTKRLGGGMRDQLEGFSAHVLEKDNRGRTLDDTLDRAGIAMRSNEFVVTAAGVMLVSFVVGLLLFGFPFFFLAAIPTAAGIPGYVKFKIARRRKKFVDQLPDTLQLMHGSLTAGYGLGQTLDSVAREADSPTSEEFQRVVMETRLGRSLEDALQSMSERIQADDFNWVVDAIKIQASVGGNLSEIIQQVGDTIRARVRIKRQIAALSAEGKISGLVLFVLPFGLFGFIYSSNPDYIKPMFSSGLGQIMLGAALLMITCGGLWLRKLVNPEF